jgi:HD-like signal output (HDOD) protein
VVKARKVTVTDRKSGLGSHGTSHEQRRSNLTAPELEELTSRVLVHFDQHKPEPASFPAMASRVIDLAEHPDVDINRLAHLIERDPAICAAVLAVANSAIHRRSSPVQSIRTAIGLLGLKRVASIAVGVACRSLFDVELRVEHELFSSWWGRLFHAAMTEAFAASFVAMERSRSASDSIFLAGLLHNIGKSLGLRSLATLIISGEVQGVPDDEAIEEVMRRARVPIGVGALTALNMPEGLVLLCARQDDEDLEGSIEWTDLHIVRLVSALNDLRMATVDTHAPIRLLLGSARAMQLRSDAILAIAQQVSEHAAQVGLLFSVTDGANETGYLEFVARCLDETG